MTDLNNRLKVIEQMISIQEAVQEKVNDTMNWFKYQIRDILTTQFQSIKDGIDQVQKKPKLFDTPTIPNSISTASTHYFTQPDSSTDILIVDTSHKNNQIHAKSAFNKPTKTPPNTPNLQKLEVAGKQTKDLFKVNGLMHKTTPQISKALYKLTPSVKSDLLTQKNEEIKSRAIRLYNANVIPRIIGRLFDFKGYWIIHVWGNFYQFPPQRADKMRLERDQCLEMYNKGFSTEEISKSLCIKTVRVKYYLGQIPNLSKFYSLEYKILACKEVMEGGDLKTACSKYRIPIQDLQLWIKEYNSTNTIKMSHYEAIKSDPKYDGVVIRNVLEEYLIDQDIEKVALKYKVTPKIRILNWIKSFNDSLYMKETGSDEEQASSKSQSLEIKPVKFQKDVNINLADEDNVLKVTSFQDLSKPANKSPEVLIPESVLSINRPKNGELTMKFLSNLKEILKADQKKC